MMSRAVLPVRNAHRAMDQATGQASLPASGRARSPNKPVYARAQIAQLYSLHRRGAYAGREAEWARQEADFYTAQREGRVLGGFDVSGKQALLQGPGTPGVGSTGAMARYLFYILLSTGGIFFSQKSRGDSAAPVPRPAPQGGTPGRTHNGNASREASGKIDAHCCMRDHRDLILSGPTRRSS